ncbi:hypothetical protein 162322556 [Organic Lake phycodnavirus 1]|nr:hypothetical protein 162322556 [Organic Lake phycodnavirus 1]
MINQYKHIKNKLSMNDEILDQNNLLLVKLMLFYKEGSNLKKMLVIINGESRTSLRIIDWFTTNYAKKYFTKYKNKKSTRFIVYEDYKLNLKAFKKQRFDPFCRWERIQVPYGDGYSIETTIGQLNFFKWAIENDIIQYIEDNYDIIEEDMNNNNSLSRSKKNLNITRKKRQELSVSASKCLKKEMVEITVIFN